MWDFIIENGLTIALSFALTISLGFNFKFYTTIYKQKNKYGDNTQIIK